MPAPFPPEFVPGAVVDPAESEAHNLYLHFGHWANVTDIAVSDAQLDLKRVEQMVRHGRNFRLWHDALTARIAREGATADPDYPGVRSPGDIAGIIEATFARKKCRWASRAEMLTDLAAIYAQAGKQADFLDAGHPEYRAGFSTNVVNAQGIRSDNPIVTDKPPATAAELQTSRALYAARPAARAR